MRRYQVPAAHRKDYGRVCLLATGGLVSLLFGLFTSSLIFLRGRGSTASYGVQKTQLRTEDGIKTCRAATVCEMPFVRCGVVNACGEDFYCGGCQFPEWCGGGGEGLCGCQPRTCASFEQTCGEVPDGCGGKVTCGTPCQRREIDPFSDEEVWASEIRLPYRVGYYEAGGDDVAGDGGPGVSRPELFSHLVFAYGRVDLERLAPAGLGDEDPDPRAEQEVTSLRRFLGDCKRGGAVPILGLGGSQEDADMAADSDSWRFVSSEDLRKEFVDGLVRWLGVWDFRGIEFHSGLRRRDRRAFLRLVVETRAALAKLGAAKGVRYWVSISIPVEYGWTDLDPDMHLLVSSVDWFSVPTHGTSKVATFISDPFPPTSAHSPIFSPPPQSSMASVVDQWLRKGVPRGKILAGLSTAGKVWKLKNTLSTEYGALSLGEAHKKRLPYCDILRQFSGRSARLGVFHPATSTVYGHNGNNWVSYDDPRTIALKVEFVVQAGLLGYGLWSINMDNSSSLSLAASSATLVPLPLVKAPLTGAVMMVTSAYPEPCSSPRGDHLLNKALKNKVDYAEKHGMRIFTSSALLEGPMKSATGRTLRALSSAWGKVPLLMEMMLHHTEVEWFMWAGPEVVFINLSQAVRFDLYRGYNLVLPSSASNGDGESSKENLVISTGAFLIRNCKWSYELLQAWLELALPDKAADLKAFRTTLGSEATEELPDDALALLYLISRQLQITPGTQGPHIFFEPHGKFDSDWQAVVGILPAVNSEAGSRKALKKSPLLTEFGGCQFCQAGDTGESGADACFEGMEMAFVSGDNQLLRRYGLQHLNLTTPKLRPLPGGPVLDSR